jgi:ATP-dependent Clp protease adaptor protein ClpS
MSEIFEKQKEKQKIKPPQMWNVVMLNDDFTTFEFVMACLMQIFNKTEQQAFKITQDIHNSGKGIVGQYPRDIAETKKEYALAFARQEEHPLHVEISEA